MPTLYDKYGGLPTMNLLVREFYKFARINPKVGRYFSKMDMDRLINHQIQFLSFVMGNSLRTFKGNELLNAHQPLTISSEDFDEMCKLLKKALQSVNITPEDIALIMGIVNELRNSIVSRQNPAAAPAINTDKATAPAQRPVVHNKITPAAAAPASRTEATLISTPESTTVASTLQTTKPATAIKKQHRQFNSAVFGGLPKIKMIVRDLYSQVNERSDLRHYFLNVTPEKIIADQEHFASYVLRKPDHAYFGPLLQSAELDIQVDAGVFSDIVDCLKNILRDAGVAEKDLPRLSTHIIEIIEETRTQGNDNKIGMLKPVDVSLDTLSKIYRRNKLEASIKGADLIYSFASVPTGLYPFPFFTQLDTTHQTLTLTCQIAAKENVTAEEMGVLVREALKYAPIMHFEARMEEPNPLFVAHYTLPYEYGIPSRLLIKIAQQFSKTYWETLNCDTEKILLKVAL